MGRGGVRTAGEGKRIGRPPKPKIEQRADKGIASQVLGSIDEVGYWRKLLRADIPLETLHTLELSERRLIEESLEYLTNRRDGKPAQGVFMGDTREAVRDVDFGNLPMPAASTAGTAGKPN